MDMNEKLVEEMVELSDVICYAMRDWDDYMDECRETETPPIDSFEDFIADGVISAGYRKQEWISVKDRLPEDDCPVLATCGKGYRPFVARYDLIWKRWRVSHTLQITHWQPMPSTRNLPQPPKGE